eukprot:5975505-Amphidinium_carterae.1
MQLPGLPMPGLWDGPGLPSAGFGSLMMQVHHDSMSPLFDPGAMIRDDFRAWHRPGVCSTDGCQAPPSVNSKSLSGT